jgi:hypothetical protein
MSWDDNPVNAWIRGGNTPAEKKKRRLVVAGVFAVIAVAGTPFTMGISLMLLLVSAKKVYNAYTDKS